MELTCQQEETARMIGTHGHSIYFSITVNPWIPRQSLVFPHSFVNRPQQDSLSQTHRVHPKEKQSKTARSCWNQ